jgi:hypothetical protein
MKKVSEMEGCEDRICSESDPGCRECEVIQLSKVKDNEINKDAEIAIQKMTDNQGYGINRIKIFYIKGTTHPNPTASKGVITIVSQVMDNGDIHFGVSYCSPKDDFVKSRGREIAIGRLMKGGDYHYRTHFTGHSSEDFIRIFTAGKDDDGKIVRKPNRFSKWGLWLDNEFHFVVGQDLTNKNF